jgi:hypothetical protein
MESLNRQEIEGQIIDLYCNKKKTYREIQKIVRKSPRDIKAILKKVEPKLSSLSTSSQAYKLYSEGRSPNEVAITLNIREPEATQLYREYWKLNQLHDLDQVYEETMDNFSSLVELYRQMKTAGMNIAHVIRLLSMANNDIRSIEYRYQELRRISAALEFRNRNAARTLEELSHVISKTQNALDHYESLRKQQRSEMEKLFHQKTDLEEFVECFESNNNKYLKIKENIKQAIENSLTNPKQLLRMALLSLIESLRKDTSKFQILYFQMSTDIAATTPSQSLTPTHSSKNCSVSNMNEKPFRDYNDPTDTFQNFVLNEAENLYDKLLEDSIDRTITDIPNDISPKVHLSPIHRTEPFGSKNSPSVKKIAAYAYRKEEEHTFIESETESEDMA